RNTSRTSSSESSWPSSIRRFLMSERTVPRRSVPALSRDLRAAARSACSRSCSSDIRSDHPRAALLATRRVLLSLPTLARLLVVPMLAKVGQDACLLALLLEAPEGTLEV